MRLTLYAFGFAAALATSGCSSLLVSDISSASDMNSARHDQFLQEQKGTNLARRYQGLPELDLCSEKYWSDRGWALKDDACRDRIARWENGDSTALNPRGMVLERTTPEISPSALELYKQLDKKRPWGKRVYR